MPIKVRVSPKILKNIATLYDEDINRMLMEYIDNSIDSADDLKKENNDEYPHDIKIDIFIDTQRKEIIFLDNCRGMTPEKLQGVVEHIGDSEKKAQAWTNGQFGYGMYVFSGFAKEMEVITKDAGSLPHRIFIPINVVEEGLETIDDMIELKEREFPYISGTRVVLKGVDTKMLKQVSHEVLKNEIEQHFELLLSAPKLEVNIHINGKEEKCTSFNYEEIYGDTIETEILTCETEGKRSVKYSFPQPIKVYLKFAPKYTNRPPLFFNNGRRIGEIAKIKTFLFKSKYGSSVWAHPCVTGYIEMFDNLKPTLPRNDFESARGKRTAVYNEILKLEEDLHDKLNQFNKEANETKFTKWELILEEALEKLARREYMKFRTMLIKDRKGDINIKNESDEEGAEEDFVFQEGDGTGKPPQRGTSEGEDLVESDNPEDSMGKAKRRFGFNIKFSDLSLDKITVEGKIPRSSYSSTEGTITIYTQHPDFEERVRTVVQGKNAGKKIFTHRLIFYISGIIASYFKDEFYSKKKLQPEIKALTESGKKVEMFEDYLGFICSLEQALQPYLEQSIDIFKDIE